MPAGPCFASTPPQWTSWAARWIPASCMVGRGKGGTVYVAVDDDAPGMRNPEAWILDHVGTQTL